MRGTGAESHARAAAHARSSPPKRSASRAAVASAAASAPGRIRAANVAPAPGSRASTSRLVRFEPGRNSDEALAMKTVP